MTQILGNKTELVSYSLYYLIDKQKFLASWSGISKTICYGPTPYIRGYYEWMVASKLPTHFEGLASWLQPGVAALNSESYMQESKAGDFAVNGNYFVNGKYFVKWMQITNLTDIQWIHWNWGFIFTEKQVDCIEVVVETLKPWKKKAAVHRKLSSVTKAIHLARKP